MSISRQLYRAEMAEHALLGARAERDLIVAAQEGDDEALEKLIRANQRLVLSVTSRYHGLRWLEWMDLVIAGNIGLLRAIRKFDVSRGLRLSTYAVDWIRLEIRRLTLRERPIYLPEQLNEMRKRAWRARDGFLAEHGRLPQAAELASLSGVSTAKLKLLAKVPLAVSLEASVTGRKGDGETTLAHFVPSEGPGPEEQAERADTRAEVLAAVGRLPANLAAPLELYYGLNGNGGRELTLEQVGGVMGYSRETARKRVQEAESRLKTMLSESYG